MKTTLTILALTIATATIAQADWPTYRANNRRSGSTDQALKLPLKKAWSHQGGTPQQAWTGPAKWDAYAANTGLQSMRNFDPCHYTTISNNKLFYGSSADNAVHCIDLKSGKELWTFFTNSAVRIPPSIAGDRLYFGSDDGFAYALNSSDGSLLWKTTAAPSSRLIFNNGKTISTHPVRTGVTLIGDQAIFAGSLLPWKDSFLLSVNQSDGKVSYQKKAIGIERPLGGYNANSTGATLQGAMLTDGTNLYIPQGRAAALKFNIKTGNKIGTIGHAGGTFCLLTENNFFLAGPAGQGARDELINLTDATGNSIASFNDTNRVVAHKGKIFLHSNGKLKALDQLQYSKLTLQKKDLESRIKKLQATLKAKAAKAKGKAKPVEAAPSAPVVEVPSPLEIDLKKLKQELKICNTAIPKTWLWQTGAPAPAELIIAGNHLICGYHGKVVIRDTRTGKQVWQTEIDGIAHGISISNGSLIISTNKGEIIAYQ